MHITKNFFLKRWYRLLGLTPASMDMVQYWKTKDSIPAKVTTAKDGSTIMLMQGEKFPFPGFPRGYLLYGKLSKLKHEIKNQIFNDSWAKLEKGVSDKEVVKDILVTLKGIYELAEETKYDMVPAQKMCPAVRELHRAWTKAGVSPELRDIVTFIFQEDDAYRFRFQWVSPYLKKDFELAFVKLENAEIIDDMKEKSRLWKRIFLLLFRDKEIGPKFKAIFNEMDWKKIYLSEGDKYHFRGKYFRCDLEVLEY